jgi:antitoxin component YwqK of YwqJK toxin-antitoxin module
MENKVTLSFKEENIKNMKTLISNFEKIVELMENDIIDENMAPLIDNFFPDHFENEKQYEDFIFETHSIKNNILKNRTYFNNGNLLFLSYTLNGKPHGIQKTFYSNGNVLNECIILNDIMVGVWKNHYYNGNIRLEQYYNKKSSNLCNGPHIEYHEKGNIKLVRFMINDRQNGPKIEFNYGE